MSETQRVIDILDDMHRAIMHMDSQLHSMSSVLSSTLVNAPSYAGAWSQLDSIHFKIVELRDLQKTNIENLGKLRKENA